MVVRTHKKNFINFMYCQGVAILERTSWVYFKGIWLSFKWMYVKRIFKFEIERSFLLSFFNIYVSIYIFARMK